MANQSLRAFAQPVSVTHPRRRLADNVVCLFPEDRPPVVQAAGRRGRYPTIVSRLSSVPRLRVGAICEIWRTDSGKNNGLIVRLLEEEGNDLWFVETVSGVDILFSNGEFNRRALCPSGILRRTFLGECHV